MSDSSEADSPSELDILGGVSASIERCENLCFRLRCGVALASMDPFDFLPFFIEFSMEFSADSSSWNLSRLDIISSMRESTF